MLLRTVPLTLTAFALCACAATSALAAPPAPAPIAHQPNVSLALANALAKIADHQPAVIFCDIMMPRLDGYQTCAIIKRNQRFANTPVVMLSSKDGVFDKARGRMVGSQDYLTKPFTKDQLLQAVQQFGALQGAN